MLQLDGAQFTVGRSRFVDRLPGTVEGSARIYVKVVPDNLGQPVLAALDTGAPWCVFEPEIADAIGLLDPVEVPARLRAWSGEWDGHLKRVLVTIPADDGEGESLEVEATVFVCPDWPAGMNFLGYSGLLERIRFAIDSQENFFYFGPSD